MSFPQLRSGNYNPIAGQSTPPVPPDATIDLQHPKYPDWLPTPPTLRSAIQAGSFFAPPFSVRPLGHLGWEPEYPDRIPRSVLPTALHPSITGPTLFLSSFAGVAAFGGIAVPPGTKTFQYQGSAAPTFVPAATDQFAWRPTYVDRPTRRHTPIESYPATSIFTSAFQVALVTGGRLGGLATPLPPVLVQYQALTGPLFQQANEDQFAWRASYPDRPGRSRPPIEGYPFTSAFAPFPEIGPHAPSVYPDRIPRPTVRPVDQQAYAANTEPIVGPFGYATYPDRIDRPVVRAATQQAYAAPVEPVVVVTYTTSIYPDRLDRLRQTREGGQVSPISPTVGPFGYAVYPDKIDPRPSLRTADQLAYTANVFPITGPFGYAVFPDRIDRLALRTAAQQAYAANLTPEVTESHAWSAIYPDRIDRLRLPTAAQQAFVINHQPEQPLAEPWTSYFPDQIARRTLPIALHPTLAFDAFPRPGAALLSAWGIFPDRIHRLTVHPSRIPSLSYGTLEPIPNPVVVTQGEEKIHLGTKESLGVTPDPTIGGWQAW